MTQLVAILNLTPDSFSDGGRYAETPQALAYIAQCVQEGASVVDIGAESTRPGATPLTHEQEWQRLEPVLAAAVACGVVISVDTRHSETARKALHLGVGWINDVTGFADPQMIEAVRDSDCKLVLMHSLTVPADPKVTLPEEAEVIEVLLDFAQERIIELSAAGIAKERIIFDPGIGFGKTARQSMRIIEEASRFVALGVPLLIGHSRKSFLSLVTGALAAERDAATVAISQRLAQAGVDYLRVHNVRLHSERLAA